MGSRLHEHHGNALTLHILVFNLSLISEFYNSVLTSIFIIINFSNLSKRMLYKKFTRDVYESEQAPRFKTYKTENGKDSLVITDDYRILKQGKRL